MTEDALITVGSKSSPIVVQLGEYEGRRVCDIRKYYEDKKTKKLMPTKKGITLTHRAFAALKNLFTDNDSKVEAWLESGNDETYRQISKSMRDRAHAQEKLALVARRFDGSSDSWRGANFFHTESKGGADAYILNEGHVFFGRIQEIAKELAKTHSPKECADIINHMVGLLIISFYRTRQRFDDKLDMDADQFFQMFEYEWGAILKNYCQAA
jgi:hypothetical protein